MIARLLAQFHEHPNCSPEDARMRSRLHSQEHEELQAEIDRDPRDPHKLARELADVVYVCYGSAYVERIDLELAVIEVHRANMDKMVANLRDVEGGKLLKPPGWRPPDMSRAIMPR